MKVLSIIQARVGSSRLSGKSIQILQGKPILEHIVNFLKFSKLIDEIIIATSNLEEDDKIEEIAKKIGVACFRGSSDDVLKRYYDCALKFGGDLIIRLTSDNPLIDPTLVDEVIGVCKETKCEYASNMIHQTFPLGYLVEGITMPTLKKIHENQHDQLSREHVTYFIRKNPHLFNIQEIFAPQKLHRPHWRLTVDYEEDFNLISEIFSQLYKPNSFISYSKVVEFLDSHTHLLKINENKQDM